MEFEAHGFPCLLLRRAGGIWAGYVALTESHPWYATPLDTLNKALQGVIHGSVTAAQLCEEDPIRGCSLPVGHPDRFRVWWIGFDCGHRGDRSPLAINLSAVVRAAAGEDFASSMSGEYRTLDFARAELLKLARSCADGACDV